MTPASPTLEREPVREAASDAPVGGQAVLEGVMMRGVSTWAVAVRKPSEEQLAAGGPDSSDGAKGEIEVISEPLVSWTKRHRLLRLPIVRGVVALGESLKIGFKALGISANAQVPPDEDGEQQDIGGGTWAGTVAFAILFAVGLFFLLPAGLTNLFRDDIPNSLVFVVIEKLIRISIFLGYLWLISRMRDLQRVFQYHGAEHKTISCYEAGLPLTPENASQFSRFHPRCGTSFLLIVMIVAIFVFAPLGKLPLALAVRLARGRDPAGGGHRLRDHQVVRPQPHQGLGARPDVAGHPASAADDPRARPVPARRRRGGAGGGPGRGGPAQGAGGGARRDGSRRLAGGSASPLPGEPQPCDREHPGRDGQQGDGGKAAVVQSAAAARKTTSSSERTPAGMARSIDHHSTPASGAWLKPVLYGGDAGSSRIKWFFSGPWRSQRPFSRRIRRHSINRLSAQLAVCRLQPATCPMISWVSGSSIRMRPSPMTLPQRARQVPQQQVDADVGAVLGESWLERSSSYATSRGC